MSCSNVKKTDRTVFKSQARKLISNVYDFMKQEAKANYAEKITDARWRTATAVGVSESTVTRILREKKENAEFASSSSAVFRSPMKKRKVMPRKLNLDEFDIGVVRRTIQNYHTEFNKFPTLVRLRNVLRERVQFDGCPNTLRKLLHKLGYKWQKTENNRKILLEKQNIKMLRLRYLKQLKTYRNESRPIVYTSVSNILINYVQNKSLTDKDSVAEPKKQKITKTTRMIIVHAGSAMGFIPNALLTYEAESKTGDYHDNMSTDKYLKWLEEKLIPNLPKDAVLVIDNAAYNNASAEKLPTSNSIKSDMQSWLTANNISYEENFKKVELFDLIMKNKDKFRRYKVDDLLNRHGFSVLRLPPYHPDLNPIENIWDIVKSYVASRNIDQNFKSAMQLLDESFEEITNDVWACNCQHVEKIEDEYMKYFDLDLSFIVNVCDTSDSEIESESSEDEFE